MTQAERIAGRLDRKAARCREFLEPLVGLRRDHLPGDLIEKRIAQLEQAAKDYELAAAVVRAYPRPCPECGARIIDKS